MQDDSKYLLVIGALVVIVGAMFAFRNIASPLRETTPTEVKPLAQAKASKEKAPSKSDAFSKTASINDYLRELAASNPAPGELEFAQVKAWDECGLLTISPDAYEKEVAMTNSGAFASIKVANYRKAALERVNSRCKTFAMTTKLTQADIGNLLQKSAAAGNVQAMARSLSMSLSGMPPDQAKEAAVTLVTSGDAQAIFEISNSFGENGPFKADEGGVIGSIASDVAWRLVACDQGMDCSSTGSFTNMACIAGGVCGPGDYRTNVQYSNFPSGTYEQALQIEALINAAISNGTVQSYFIHK